MTHMNFKTTFFKYVFLLLLVGGASYAHASIIRGAIDSTYYTAQVCEDTSCTVTSTSPVNFGHFTTAATSNVVVLDDELTGFIWGTKFGWVVLNCTNTTSGCSSTNGNFKVANDKNGHLSGYAWGESAGWINFGPFVNNASSRITINAAGQFNGYAWSQNFGWIKFDCSSASACVTTDWRPQNTRPQCSDGLDNDSDRYIDAADGACHTDGNDANPGSYDPTLNREQAQQFHPNLPIFQTPPPITEVVPTEVVPTPTPVITTPKPTVKKPVIKTPQVIPEPTTFPEFVSQPPQGVVEPVQPPTPPEVVETHYLPSFLRAIGLYLRMVPAPDANTVPKMKGPGTSPQGVNNATPTQTQTSKLTFIQKVVNVAGHGPNSIGNFFNSIFSKTGK